MVARSRWPAHDGEGDRQLFVLIGNGGNGAVLPTNEGEVLVDDKFAQDAPEIVAKVKTVSDKPIRYILNMHQHGDHTGGNEILMATPAEVIAHRNARANMVTLKQPGLLRITFSDETQVFVGGKEGVRATSDAPYERGCRPLFPVRARAPHGRSFRERRGAVHRLFERRQLMDWDKTLEQALQLDFDIVIPGHGPVAKKADLEKWRHTLATLRSRATEGCGQGGADALKQMKLDDLGMKPSPLFERSMAGMCQELAR